MLKRFAAWLNRRDPTPPFEEELFRDGRIDPSERDFVFELYKLMVNSSESLVSRRQGVNTFFLTANGALLTATSFIVGNGSDRAWTAIAVAVLTTTGAVLSVAWQTLLISFGQLNSGKFAIINRLEREFPVAVYAAEWKALGEGKNPRVYRSFTSREVWAPRVFLCLYVLATLIAVGFWFAEVA